MAIDDIKVFDERVSQIIDGTGLLPKTAKGLAAEELVKNLAPAFEAILTPKSREIFRSTLHQLDTVKDFQQRGLGYKNAADRLYEFSLKNQESRKGFGDKFENFLLGAPPVSTGEELNEFFLGRAPTSYTPLATSTAFAAFSRDIYGGVVKALGENLDIPEAVAHANTFIEGQNRWLRENPQMSKLQNGTWEWGDLLDITRVAIPLAAGQAPNIALGVIGTGATALGMAPLAALTLGVMATREFGASYLDLRAKGASPEAALLPSIGAAVINTAIEKMSFNLTAPIFKPLLRTVGLRALGTSRTIRSVASLMPQKSYQKMLAGMAGVVALVKGGAQTTGVEVAEEMFQELLGGQAMSYFALDNEITRLSKGPQTPEVKAQIAELQKDLDGVFNLDQILNAGKQAAGSSVLFGVYGGVNKVLANRGDAVQFDPAILGNSGPAVINRLNREFGDRNARIEEIKTNATLTKEEKKAQIDAIIVENKAAIAQTQRLQKVKDNLFVNSDLTLKDQEIFDALNAAYEQQGDTSNLDAARTALEQTFNPTPIALGPNTKDPFSAGGQGEDPAAGPTAGPAAPTFSEDAGITMLLIGMTDDEVKALARGTQAELDAWKGGVIQKMEDAGRPVDEINGMKEALLEVKLPTPTPTSTAPAPAPPSNAIDPKVLEALGVKDRANLENQFSALGVKLGTPVDALIGKARIADAYRRSLAEDKSATARLDALQRTIEGLTADKLIDELTKAIAPDSLSDISLVIQSLPRDALINDATRKSIKGVFSSRLKTIKDEKTRNKITLELDQRIAEERGKFDVRREVKSRFNLDVDPKDTELDELRANLTEVSNERERNSRRDALAKLINEAKNKTLGTNLDSKILAAVVDAHRILNSELGTEALSKDLVKRWSRALSSYHGRLILGEIAFSTDKVSNEASLFAIRADLENLMDKVKAEFNTFAGSQIRRVELRNKLAETIKSILNETRSKQPPDQKSDNQEYIRFKTAEASEKVNMAPTPEQAERAKQAAAEKRRQEILAKMAADEAAGLNTVRGLDPVKAYGPEKLASQIRRFLYTDVHGEHHQQAFERELSEREFTIQELDELINAIGGLNPARIVHLMQIQEKMRDLYKVYLDPAQTTPEALMKKAYSGRTSPLAEQALRVRGVLGLTDIDQIKDLSLNYITSLDEGVLRAERHQVATALKKTPESRVLRGLLVIIDSELGTYPESMPEGIKQIAEASNARARERQFAKASVTGNDVLEARWRALREKIIKTGLKAPNDLAGQVAMLKDFTEYFAVRKSMLKRGIPFIVLSNTAATGTATATATATDDDADIDIDELLAGGGLTPEDEATLNDELAAEHEATPANENSAIPKKRGAAKAADTNKPETEPESAAKKIADRKAKREANAQAIVDQRQARATKAQVSAASKSRTSFMFDVDRLVEKLGKGALDALAVGKEMSKILQADIDGIPDLMVRFQTIMSEGLLGLTEDDGKGLLGNMRQTISNINEAKKAAVVDTDILGGTTTRPVEEATKAADITLKGKGMEALRGINKQAVALLEKGVSIDAVRAQFNEAAAQLDGSDFDGGLPVLIREAEIVTTSLEKLAAVRRSDAETAKAQAKRTERAAQKDQEIAASNTTPAEPANVASNTTPAKPAKDAGAVNKLLDAVKKVKKGEGKGKGKGGGKKGGTSYFIGERTGDTLQDLFSVYAILNKILPLEMLGITITEVPSIAVTHNDLAGTTDVRVQLGAKAQGSWDRISQVIELAYEGGITREAAYHEVFHAVQDLALTIEERQILATAFPDKDGRTTRELQAEAFASFAIGKKSLFSANKVVRLFQKTMNVLNRIRNGLKGLGFQTYKDILENTLLGKYLSTQRKSESTAHISDIVPVRDFFMKETTDTFRSAWRGFSDYTGISQFDRFDFVRKVRNGWDDIQKGRELTHINNEVEVIEKIGRSLGRPDQLGWGTDETAGRAFYNYINLGSGKFENSGSDVSLVLDKIVKVLASPGVNPELKAKIEVLQADFTRFISQDPYVRVQVSEPLNPGSKWIKSVLNESAYRSMFDMVVSKLANSAQSFHGIVKSMGDKAFITPGVLNADTNILEAYMQPNTNLALEMLGATADGGIFSYEYDVDPNTLELNKGEKMSDSLMAIFENNQITRSQYVALNAYLDASRVITETETGVFAHHEPLYLHAKATFADLDGRFAKVKDELVNFRHALAKLAIESGGITLEAAGRILGQNYIPRYKEDQPANRPQGGVGNYLTPIESIAKDIYSITGLVGEARLNNILFTMIRAHPENVRAEFIVELPKELTDANATEFDTRLPAMEAAVKKFNESRDSTAGQLHRITVDRRNVWINIKDPELLGALLVRKKKYADLPAPAQTMVDMFANVAAFKRYFTVFSGRFAAGNFMGDFLVNFLSGRVTLSSFFKVMFDQEHRRKLLAISEKLGNIDNQAYINTDPDRVVLSELRRVAKDTLAGKIVEVVSERDYSPIKIFKDILKWSEQTGRIATLDTYITTHKDIIDVGGITPEERNRRWESVMREGGRLSRGALNFNQAGTSKGFNTLMRTASFGRVAITGLDVFLRHMSGMAKAISGKVRRGEPMPPEMLRSLRNISLMMATGAIIEMMLGDDEDYKNIPDELKAAYWFIPGPVGWIAIRKPFEIGTVFANFSQMVVRYSRGEPGVLQAYLAKVLGSITPTLPLTWQFGGFLGAIFQQSGLKVMPDLLELGAQIAENREYFANQFIEPPYLAGKDSDFRGRSTDSNISKMLASILPFSSTQWDFVIRQVGSNWGTAITNWDRLLSGEFDPDKSYADLTPVRAFWRSDNDIRNKTVSSFFNIREKVVAMHELYNIAKKEKDPDLRERAAREIIMVKNLPMINTKTERAYRKIRDTMQRLETLRLEKPVGWKEQTSAFRFNMYQEIRETNAILKEMLAQ